MEINLIISHQYTPFGLTNTHRTRELKIKKKRNVSGVIKMLAEGLFVSLTVITDY
jgi:hypothetical protein